ncbi:MAG: polysaccharide lyase [Rhodothermales bacterium]
MKPTPFFIPINVSFSIFTVVGLSLMLLLARPATAQEFSADLNNHPLGNYTESLMESDFSSVQLLNNLGNRFTLIDGAEAYDGKSLRVTYFAGETGASNSGGQFFAFLPAQEEYYLDYYIKFGDDFDFQMGGKLPGLSGGESNSGGNKPNGDGWSARYMWREDGNMVVYLYHMDQPTSYGEDFELNRNVERGTWHRLTQRVKVNSGNNNDGELQIWFDGELVMLRTDIRFRNNNQAPVDHLFFSTFHGGNTPEWEPDTDGYVYYDNIRIGTNKDDILPDADSGLLTQIDKPSNGAQFEAPASITIEASAFSLESDVSTVDIYANNTLLGSATSPPYSFNWSSVAPGTYSITATATDEQNETVTSSPVIITVSDVNPEKGPNLALNKQTTVTAEQEGNSGSGAVDGSADDNDRWSAQGFAQSLTVDLGAVQSVNLAELVPFSDRAYQYTIATSVDNSTFNTVVNRSANTEGGALLSDSFNPTEARYVRLNVTGASNYSGEWISIIEFRLFNTNGGSGGPILGDTSLDGTISALDASLILQHSVGLIQLDGQALTNSDVSGNGAASTFDASLVLQHVVNLINCFPAEAGCD